MATGLPENVVACLFDMDGVLTETAILHAEAWKRTFDEFLERRARSLGEPLVPFDQVEDYDRYVDGRPRLDGTRAFLEARGIALPEGTPDDPPGADTVEGLARRKNDLVLGLMKERGVSVYPGSLRFVQEVRRLGLATAVVSSSANTQTVLAAAGIEGLFDARVDGTTVTQRHLAGKPAPDTYLEAARLLDVAPAAAAVFEDAVAGVEAGHRGGFGFVVGVDRVGQAEELRAHGADIVVKDLGELLGAG